MPRGLFELRKDAITGWWVAVVVDREFERQRFHRPAKHLGPDRRPIAPTAISPGDGVRLRMLKPEAFIVAGGEREAERESAAAGARTRAGHPRRRRLVADDRGAARPPRVARRDEPADRFRAARARTRRAGARARTGRAPITCSRPELRPAGRRPDRPSVLRLLRPAADSRTASARSSAAPRGS